MFQRFKKMIIVKVIWWMNWLIRKSKKIVYWLNIDWFRRTRKSIIECRKLEKKIDNWFVDKIFIFHHDWLIDFQNKKINNWLLFSQTHDHFRWFTMRQMKIKCNHRFQRENFSWKFVLLFHSRKFVLLFRDSSRKDFRFVDLKMFYVNFSFNLRRFVLLFRDLFLKKLFDDFI